jgi:Fe-S-cluster-containing dehydrogenase component
MIFEFEDCGGCTTCELACSYQRTGEFNHHVSSIQIIQMNNKSGFFVNLVQDDKNRYICEGCMDCNEPMCVTYCRQGQDLMKIINQYREVLIANEESENSV